ncbi:MAG: DUF4367 domain-containing protein [Eubacteriales bacterium]|nr:DUF4367 domain-containing protein [Eubacteriales bacterium]
MSENQNRGIQDFSKYDTMETEALEEILRLDAEAPEGQEPDTELLLYVMGVLADRKRNSDNPGKTAQEAWDSFQRHYLPCGEEESNSQETESEKYTPWLRRLIAAAAVVTLIFLIPLTASALGWEDIWPAVAKWAKETFSFVSRENTEVSVPSPEDEENYTSLREALEDNNRNADMIPTWIPDGYEFKSLKKDVTPIREAYIANYVNGDNVLTVRVQTYMSKDAQNIEIEEEDSEVYIASEKKYYIFKNEDQIRAVWIVDSYECIISGDLSLDEVKTMIDSIGKG